MEIKEIYMAYLDCLNRQDWDRLRHFVDDDVNHNGRMLHLDGYRDMLVQDFLQIPDLRFEAELLICESTRIAARLRFDCAPSAIFLDLPVNGKRVTFREHVLYEFAEHKIIRVWSVIDKAEIERQLR